MSTSIEQLMNSNQGNGASMNEVDAILEELNNKPQQQPSIQPPNTQPKQITGPPSPQMQQMMHQIQQQQSQLQQLSNMNREKDLFIQQNIQNNEKKPELPVDLLTEFKSTLIIFSILIIFNLPVLNKFITTSIGIENDNTIFAILKTFIVCIIFFLINKFI